MDKSKPHMVFARGPWEGMIAEIATTNPPVRVYDEQTSYLDTGEYENGLRVYDWVDDGQQG